jgi:hypothetical protein
MCALSSEDFEVVAMIGRMIDLGTFVFSASFTSGPGCRRGGAVALCLGSGNQLSERAGFVILESFPVQTVMGTWRLIIAGRD